MQLGEVAQRVLGALVEKAMATPQGYPLSLNALRAACNQTTGRDPVTDFDEAQIGAALKELAAGSLVRAAYARRSSTPKYEHLLGEHLEIDDAQVALLGVLLLRGAQTVGELRQRTDRMHHFADLGEVQAALDALAGHPYGALAEQLPRQPGQKELRWRHLLGGEEPGGAAPVGSSTGTATGGAGAATAAEVEALRAQLAAVLAELAELQQAVSAQEQALQRLRRFVGADDR